MKNQIIKKIMAYLLVGAMVITTPMTASATELENAYSTGVDQDTDNTSGSNTNTNTNTQTKAIDIPGIIEDYNFNITGIMLDKEALSFNEVDAEGHPVSEALQARVLFDDYDPTGEPMEWASLGYDEKQKIEKQIHWYSDDNDVAKVVWAKSDPKEENGKEDDKIIVDAGNLKALVKPKGVGQTNVYAWIEADGKQYVNNPDRPTPGDYIATAVVTVTEKITSIKFEKPEDFYFFEKRTYDLKEYTNLETSAKTSIPASSKGAETLIYSLEGTAPKGCTVTLTEDGILTVKKAKQGMSIKFNAIATKSKTSDNEFVKLSNEEIKFGNAIHATHVTIKESGTAVKSKILDLGDVNNAETEVTVTLEKKKGKTVEKTVDVTTPAKERNSGENITDVVTWTSKNSKIADVVPVTVKDENGNVVTKDDLSRLVVAKGVGSTTITATASSGKKSTLKVTVDATPSGLKIVDINEETSGKTYTGKRTTLTAVLTAKDKNGNEFELPLGKAKIKWESSNKKLAPISAKKDVGTVKPANLLKKNAQVNDEESVTITATVSGKDSNKKTYKVPKAAYTLKITQSSISDISISKKANSTDSNEINNGFKTLVQTGSRNKKGNDTAYIGNDVDYVASPKEIEFADAIGWTISGAAATIDDNGKLTPVKPGKATISANYVTILPNGKAKLNKKTVAVTVIQNATSIAFVKEQTVKNPSPKEKPQAVTLKVKSIEPKKATCNVASWKTLAYIIKKDGDTYTPYTIEDKSVEPKKTGNNITKCTNNSVTVKIPGDAQAGSVIKVGAYTNGGVVAYAYIYVTGKTTRVKVDTPKTEFRLGETASIGKVMVELGKDENKKIIENEAAFKNALFGNGGTQGDTTAYITEPVTYSVDKNSAKFIKVDQNGNVTGIQKTGKKTATVTIKTVSGKSAKVKIKVN
jgi:hypothetical protein